MENIQVQVSSEIGELEAIIIHTPGQEVANMTPQNAERALYSDILNLSVAQKEYSQFKGVVQKHAKTFEVRDLLADILKKEDVKNPFIDSILKNENSLENKNHLLSLDEVELARQLIEGVKIKRDNLTNFLNPDRYSMRPLHNFFFTRDASMSVNNNVLIGKMASQVRDRETLIMEAIFNHHPLLTTTTINANKTENFDPKTRIEGGDVLIAREDVLVIGTGLRTSSQGIDFILNKVKKEKIIKHIIVQELPSSPESFIHLDMVFTFLDKNKAMVYEPVILTPNKYKTIHINMDGDKIKITNEDNILVALRNLGIDLEPVFCGGKEDSWKQEREQWHSGANFFAFGPGKVIGYARNVYTMEQMNRHGFEVIKACDVLSNKISLADYNKYVVTIEGSELARGGGGGRCMSMPIRRKLINW